MFILPTMSRPEQCAKVLRKIGRIGCTSAGVVFVNGESHVDEYRVKLKLPSGWQVIYWHENIGALGALNKVFEMFPDEPWYGFIADDEFIEYGSRKDWDLRLIAAAGDWRVAHGWEDWNFGSRCQGYPVFGGKLVRAVGYLACRECFHNFGFDCMWEWMNGRVEFGGGGLKNIVCLPEIRIRHNRANPDIVIDDCYKIVDDRKEEDRKRFWDWVRNDMRLAVERVRKGMA
jgi:hypothetical protein